MFRNSAHIYDMLYGDERYARESSDLVAIVDQYAKDARTLLDVACGTGGHLRRLKARFQVTGIDLDAAMLKQARLADNEVEFVEGDMRAFDLGRRFDVVLCLFSSIGYARNNEELRATVAALARHLADNGVIVVDGWVRPDEWKGDVSLHLQTAEDDKTKIARVSRSVREGNRTTLNMEYLVATTDRIEHVVDRHELRLHTPEEYADAFAKAGLAITVTGSPWPGRDRYIARHQQLDL